MTSSKSLSHAVAAVLSSALVLGAAAAVVAGPTPAAPATPATVTAPSPAAVTTAKPAISKVLTFVVENHSLDQMRGSMPFVYGLATQYAYADNYTAVTHPSLPNYLAIASGSTQGVRDDKAPAYHRLGATTVFDQAIARRKTAKVYADAMTRNCQLTSSGRYAVKHNPWAYFTKGRTSCGRYDVPIGRLAADVRAGTLPNVGMVVPDLVHDAHDASLAASDAWIEQQVRLIQTGTDWRTGRLAIVITADEDDRASGNKVLTVVASRYQTQMVTHTPLTHYSLTRLYGSVIGAPYLGHAATARSMRVAFGITTPSSR